MSVIRYLLKKFKKYNPLQIENGDKLNIIQILAKVFNDIKESDALEVKEKEVLDYINDQNNPP
jgi:hypothetical protein